MDCDATVQVLIIYSAFVKYFRKRWEYNEAVYQLFIDFKKAHDSVKRDVLYNILIEFGTPMKLVRLCRNDTYSRVWVVKHLSEMLPIKNGLKQGGACCHYFSTVFRSTPLGRFR